MTRGFDRLAKPYRWLEYMSFGRALERCRFRFLPALNGARNALLLGDGDGRFAERLLQSVPLARVHAVDGSPAMLAALRQRCAAAGTANRLTIQCADLRQSELKIERGPFDLVATHFFLDCLSDAAIEALVARTAPLLTRHACWVVSEFHIPPGAMRLPARLLVRGLYLAFRILTGLRVSRLPDHAAIFLRLGFRRVQRELSLRGLLLSELWIRGE